MSWTRRDLLKLSVGSLPGVAFLRGSTSTGATSTPSASPVASGEGILVSAADAMAMDPAPLWLAVMDEVAHAEGHIDGDVRIGWDEITLADTSAEGIASWRKEMRHLLGVRGVRHDVPVVVYDDGSLFAARGWWQLAYMGFSVPMVMDGGLAGWRAAVGEVVSGTSGLDRLEVPLIDEDLFRPELLATKDEVLASLDDPGVLIVDARSSDEFAMGHIPGAVNALYTDNANMKDANSYLPPDVLSERYGELGMAQNKRAITYCSTGARGAVAAFAIRLAGFRDVALYAGSWSEWSIDPDAPVEQG